jgi:acetyl esterase
MPVVLDPDSAAVYQAFLESARPPFESITPAEAREFYLQGRIANPEPPELKSVQPLAIPSPTGSIAARIYTPLKLRQTDGLAPCLVFFHGGGWVIGDLDTHDVVCRKLADEGRLMVISVDYRRAPEHKFPAAVDDAIDATKWIAGNARQFGIDATRLMVGGDSAGGNLAAVTAQQAVRRGGAVPAFQLLMYLPTDLGTRRPAHDLFAECSTFTDQNFRWALANYLPPGADLSDPRLSPLHGEVTDLPPAYIASAGFDPLRDDAISYADKLRAGGVPVTLSRQPDLPHGYLNFVGLGGRFAEAAGEAAGALRLGLAAARPQFTAGAAESR